MIFKQWEQVLDGTKTQTRRPCKGEDEEYTWCTPTMEDGLITGHRILEVCGVGAKKNYLRWAVGRTYAVQPGRGRPAIWIRPDGSATDTPLDEYVQKLESGTRRLWGPKVKAWLREHGYIEARIRITKIRRERLGDISCADVFAEGLGMYNPLDGKHYPTTVLDVAQERYAQLWNHIYGPAAWERMKDDDCWVLEFERCEE